MTLTSVRILWFNSTMNVIAISRFRQKLYQLVANIRNEAIVFSYKHKKYRVIDEEEYQKLETMQIWNKFPKFNMSAEAVKQAVNDGRKY